MNGSLKASAQKVQDALDALGLDCQVIELADSTRTSTEAAAAVGCDIGQIAKSLIFRGKMTGNAVLLIVSGANRVDVRAAKTYVGEAISQPDADFVRERTGYAIGGVPPLAHAHPLTTFIDRDLLAYNEIWAAAGHPHALFRLTPADLIAMTAAPAVQVT